MLSSAKVLASGFSLLLYCDGNYFKSLVKKRRKKPLFLICMWFFSFTLEIKLDEGDYNMVV